MQIKGINKAPTTPRTADCFRGKGDTLEMSPIKLFRSNKRQKIQEHKVLIAELKIKINSLRRFQQVNKAREHLEKLKELFYSSIQYKSMMHLKQDELVTSFRYYNELEKEKMEILADKERQVENLLKRVNRKTIKRVIKSKNKEIEKGLPAILQLLN